MSMLGSKLSFLMVELLLPVPLRFTKASTGIVIWFYEYANMVKSRLCPQGAMRVESFEPVPQSRPFNDFENETEYS